MPQRARVAVIGAGAVGVLGVLLWWLVHDVAVIRQADANLLAGFMSLRRPRLDVLTNAIAHLCDPGPYVVWAAIVVAVALLRGRPRVAVTLAVIFLGANETTELLKPLLGGARDPVAGHWFLSDATWPSGHATASMTLALCAVIGAPARRRPAVAAAMAAFSVAVVFSFLELGWHYPSDALGGFCVATLWTLIGLAGLWTYEAHQVGDRALQARVSAPRPALARADRPQAPAFSVTQAFAPSLAIIVAVCAAGALIVAARPHEALVYAHLHTGFLIGAAAIGSAAFALASTVSLLLRGGSIPRPVAPRLPQRLV